jgi:hypothetical protein
MDRLKATEVNPRVFSEQKYAHRFQHPVKGGTLLCIMSALEVVICNLFYSEVRLL